MSTNLLGVEEAAVRLGIKAGTLRHWLSERRLPYVKMGRRTLLDPRELERIIEQNTVREQEISEGRGRVGIPARRSGPGRPRSTR